MIAPPLTDLAGPRRQVLLLAYEIAVAHGIEPVALLGSDRSRKYAWPRQELYWRAKRLTGLGRVWLGKILGRDRQTIWHGIRAHELRMAACNRNGMAT